MRTSNHFFKESNSRSYTVDGERAMTVQGTMNKLGILLLMTIASASFAWYNILYTSPGLYSTYLMVGGIGALVAMLIVTFNPNAGPYAAPAYAILKGLVLGALSAMFNHLFDGIVFKAVLLTAGIVGAMYFGYTSGYIKVTEKFRSGVLMAFGGIIIMYLINLVLSLFGFPLPFLHEASPLGLLIALAIVVVASLYLVLEFDSVYEMAESGVEKKYEWYAAFGVLWAIIWLYIEVLRLIALLASMFGGD